MPEAHVVGNRAVQMLSLTAMIWPSRRDLGTWRDAERRSVWSQAEQDDDGCTMLEPCLSTFDISLHFVLSIQVYWEVGDEGIGSCPEACVDQTFVSLDDQRHQSFRRIGPLNRTRELQTLHLESLVS